jgi:PTS system nitrogen regulatory IIA component
MKLTINELSRQIGVSQKTIERWIVQGRLPVSKDGNQYHFHLKELQKWASAKNINLNVNNKTTTSEHQEVNADLALAIHHGGLYKNIKGSDTRTVLKNCLEKNNHIASDFKSDLLDRLIERESALSTGIGNGIAIPHPREPLAYLNNPIIPVCFLEQPIEYQAIDQKPVSVLFLLLSPTLNLHLQLLSNLSFYLRNDSFLEFSKSSPDPAQLVERIRIFQTQNG